MARELAEIWKLLAQAYADGDCDYVQDVAAECADDGEVVGASGRSAIACSS
ncbi:hypothetical protein FHS78_001957 [Parvibaculum indicum]|uniref:hypothetical protein n=1 Tax=Parvibaculum indicum TaxID=562969 RepID=UPI00141F3743|nr:hypothetical protein [Parvibaculum indicum]NIJ41667.1 hypothetical protein [Parvibaculum indicum]